MVSVAIVALDPASRSLGRRHSISRREASFLRRRASMKRMRGKYCFKKFAVYQADTDSVTNVICN